MARGQHAWFKKIHWSEAEKISGQKLDRRIQYYIHTEEGKKVDNPYAFNGSDMTPEASLLTYGEWTEACSGCTRGYEEAGYFESIGGGCEECGYTGKRRQGMHTPLDLDPELKERPKP